MDIINLQEIKENFFTDVLIYKCEKGPQGNINKSYALYLSNGKKYLLQKINTSIFKNPVAIMDNAILISSHLKTKGKTFIEYVYGIDNKPYFQDENKNFWRVMTFIPHAISYSQADNTDKAYQTGVAYGAFCKNLIDLDVRKLKITVDGLHDKERCYEELKRSFENTDRKRPREFLFLCKTFEEILNNNHHTKNMPVRIVHNDTKIDNVLFDEAAGTYIVVIDIDTTMPGYVINDFGDAARSVSSTSNEDETDLRLIKFDLDKFEAFTEGYLSEASQIITDTEKNALFYGVESITAELACRFLTDYFNHDIHFGIKYPEHNLDRALNQITLLKDILIKQDKIMRIINKYCE